VQLVNKSITEVFAGYSRILNGENEILHHWRDALLDVYAHQRSIYEGKVEEYSRQRSRFLSRIRIGIWLSSGILVLGLIILPLLITISEVGDLRGPLVCFSPILILGGLTGWSIIILLWIWQRSQSKPEAPPHPLKSDLVPALLPAWKSGLIGQIHAERPEENVRGMITFIARLQMIEPETFILHKLQLADKLRLDIALVGPRGIWLFKVINHEGIITWRDGHWTQRRTIRRVGSPALIEFKEPDDTFDQQWRKAADGLIAHLTETLPELVESTPNILRVRGGLVFTHPKVKVDIPAGCPFNWGLVPFWLNKLGNVPVVSGFDDATILRIIEALIDRHQTLVGNMQKRSVLEYANELIASSELRIKSYIDLTDNK
jgi:hypothetical protein